jgi:hypothetical protein
MPKTPIRFEFVITTIDVIEIEYACPVKYGEDAKVVELHARIQSRKNDNDVAFLLNLKSTKIFGVDDDNKVIVYQGIKVSERVFQKRLLAHNKKFLACIHGYSVEPEKFLPRYVCLFVSGCVLLLLLLLLLLLSPIISIHVLYYIFTISFHSLIHYLL